MSYLRIEIVISKVHKNRSMNSLLLIQAQSLEIVKAFVGENHVVSLVSYFSLLSSSVDLFMALLFLIRCLR